MGTLAAAFLGGRAALAGVVEDDPERVALARVQPADTMTHCNAIGAARAGDRTLVHRKDHCLALLQADDVGTGLYARALLGQHELAAGKVGVGAAEQECGLQGEMQVAIQVLVQAVVVAGP